MMIEPDEHMTLGEIKRLYKEGKLKANPVTREQIEKRFGKSLSFALRKPLNPKDLLGMTFPSVTDLLDENYYKE